MDKKKDNINNVLIEGIFQNWLEEDTQCFYLTSSRHTVKTDELAEFARQHNIKITKYKCNESEWTTETEPTEEEKITRIMVRFFDEKVRQATIDANPQKGRPVRVTGLLDGIDGVGIITLPLILAKNVEFLTE